MSQRVRVGVVTGAVGLEGAVKVESLTGFDGRFTPGASVELAGMARRVEWVRHPIHPEGRPGRATPHLVLKVSGVDDREAAERQRGSYLEVPIESVPRLPDGQYYHYQLAGLAVVTAGGRPIGELAEVMERPANDVWVVRSAEGERLVPATREAVLEVDLEAGRVVVADWVFDVEEAR